MYVCTPHTRLAHLYYVFYLLSIAKPTSLFVSARSRTGHGRDGRSPCSTKSRGILFLLGLRQEYILLFHVTI